MQKIIVVFKEPLVLGAAGSDRARAIVDQLRTFPLGHCVGITAHIKTGELAGDLLPAGSFDLSIACALSLWVPSSEDVAALLQPLRSIGIPDAIYSVVESTPRDYSAVHWKEGERSPGATLFAMFNRRQELTREAFLTLWQDHTAISLRFHPLIKYHRNAVARRLSAGGADWDGIVEERVAEVADLTPERWFIGTGAREKAVASMHRFVDTPGMRCGLLEEFIVRKPPWL